MRRGGKRQVRVRVTLTTSDAALAAAILANHGGRAAGRLARHLRRAVAETAIAVQRGDYE